MRKLAIAAACILAGSSQGHAGTGYGQLVFQNRTSVAGDMYYGETYGCYAQGGAECPSMVRPGRYSVHAKFRDNTLSGSTVIDVVEGQVSTFTVTE